MDNIEQVIRAIPRANDVYTIFWDRIERTLLDYETDYGLNLTPSFQRGHVWSHEQQTHYIENTIRGLVSDSQRTIIFTSAEWDGKGITGDLDRTVMCVDGLQRLTAVRNFMRGEVQPFGLSLSDLADTKYDPRRMLYTLHFQIFSFKNTQDLLQYYIDINSGGTPHSAEEIQRVKSMLLNLTTEQ